MPLFTKASSLLSTDSKTTQDIELAPEQSDSPQIPMVWTHHHDLDYQCLSTFQWALNCP